MRKISNFCGIFATLFVTTTMVLLASCSQDDDYYESDMYTLAEMGTRLGGKGDSGDGETPKPQKIYTCKVVKNNQTYEAGNEHPKNDQIELIYCINSSFDINSLTCDPSSEQGIPLEASILAAIPHGDTIFCTTKVFPTCGGMNVDTLLFDSVPLFNFH